MNENISVTKSLDFAVRIVNLYKYLTQEHKEYIMSRQILRCGTSIGANIAEAQRGQSMADFAAKMNIALKEASETEYWIKSSIGLIICKKRNMKVYTMTSMIS